MSIVKRVIAAVTLSLAAAGFTVNETGLPVPVERAAIMAGLMILTPEMEGTVYEAYPDTGGVWTICTGHTKGVRSGDVATQEQCAAYLQGDLGGAVDLVMREFPKATIWQKIALADFVYNLGAPALLKSTLYRLAKAGQWRAAADQFGRWTYVAGRDCRILANNCRGIPMRRDLQRTLFLVGQ
ncbi:lysozyme [Pseudomonas juntendi]|uniref:lysozyme n=1 Tax=Pseudomonas juntendi TaxID=2666183 RepID=UPI00244D2FFF|nr:lysozyme [Pseudomonas juntendi]MDH1551012.1 lysozyme [Pseudomonas juntendi]